MAWTPKAVAEWVFPVPGPPISTTFWARSRNSHLCDWRKVAAYERSCQRYSAIAQSLPDPDPLRLRHRDQIRAAVRDIIVEGSASLADYLPPDTDPNTLVLPQAIVDVEVDNLHAGNAPRFGIRRSQLDEWKRRTNK